MERSRCKSCGEIYDSKEETCPKCGSSEKTQIAFPDPVWEE